MVDSRKFIEIIDWDINASLQHGVTNYFLGPCYAMADVGYTTELVCLVKDKKLKPFPIDEHKVKVIYLTSFLSYFTYLLKNRKNIIYANSRTFQTLCVPFFSKNSFFVSHGNPIPGVENFFLKRWIKISSYKLALSLFKGIRAISKAEFEILNNWLIGFNKVRYIPLVVDHKYYSQNLLPSKGIKKKYNIPSHKKIILFFAVFSPRKRPEVLIQALSILKQKRNDFFVIFSGPDYMKDEGKKTVYQQVQEEGLVQETLFTGKIEPDKIKEIFTITDIAVSTSAHEGAPVAIAEAAARGVGLCLSNIPGFREYDYAFFHEIGDSKKLAQDLEKYLDNPQLLSEHKEKNALVVKNLRDYDTVNKQLVHFFTQT